MSFLKIYKSKIATSGSGNNNAPGPNAPFDDVSASFTSTVKVGDLFKDTGSGATTSVVAVVSDTQITLANTSGMGILVNYEIYNDSPGDTYSLLNASKYLFAYQANTGGGEIRFIYSDDVNSGYLNINTNLTSDADAELYIQSINDAIGSLSNGVFIGPTNVINVEAPSGAIITGFSFN
jgi:hypothetical protein